MKKWRAGSAGLARVTAAAAKEEEEEEDPMSTHSGQTDGRTDGRTD